MAVLKISLIEFFNSLSEMEFCNRLMICSGWFGSEWIQSSLFLGFLHGQRVPFYRFSVTWMSILKHETHVKVGHTSEFPFGIYWWTLEKPKNQTFEKMKIFTGDIIILHMCTKNHNHMRYSSWDTKWDRISYHFGSFSALLTRFPVTTQKTKILKKWKKHLEMS